MENLWISIIYSVVCILLSRFVTGLDIQQVEEGSCAGLSNTTTPLLDNSWLRSIPRWYVIAGSKYHLYRAIRHHYNDSIEALERIPEHKFYYESCLMIDTPTRSSGIANVTGFEPGWRSPHNMTEFAFGVDDFMAIPYNGNVGVSRHFVTLTDNHSFVFYTNCNFGPNQKSWDVFATKDTLSPEVMKQIEEHAVNEGFDRKHFAWLRYNTCLPGVLDGPANSSPASSSPAPMWPEERQRVASSISEVHVAATVSSNTTPMFSKWKEPRTNNGGGYFGKLLKKS